MARPQKKSVPEAWGGAWECAWVGGRIGRTHWADASVNIIIYISIRLLRPPSASAFCGRLLKPPEHFFLVLTEKKCSVPSI